MNAFVPAILLAEFGHLSAVQRLLRGGAISVGLISAIVILPLFDIAGALGDALELLAKRSALSIFPVTPRNQPYSRVANRRHL